MASLLPTFARSHRRAAALTLLLGGMLLASVAGRGAAADDAPGDALGALFLQAERAENPREAAALWHALLARPDLNRLGGGIDSQTVLLNLIHALIQSAQSGKDFAAFQEAQALANTLVDPVRKAWSLLYLCRTGAVHTPLEAIKACRDAENAVTALPISPAKSHAARGLVEVALSKRERRYLFKEEGLTMAELWAMQPGLAADRRQALHLTAVAQLEQEGNKAYAAAISKKTAKQQTQALAAAAWDRLRKEDFKTALALALAIDPRHTSERAPILEEIYRLASTHDAFHEALTALAGNLGGKKQAKILVPFVEEQLAAGEMSRAGRIAALIGEGEQALDAWALLAKRADEEGYKEWRQHAHERMWQAVETIEDPAKRQERFAKLAKLLAELHDSDMAQLALQRVDAASEDHAKALAAVVKSMAEEGKPIEASKLLSQLDDAPKKDRLAATAAVAKALAEEGKLDLSLRLLKGVQKHHAPLLDKARLALVKALCEEGRIDDADDLVGSIEDPAMAAEAKAIIAYRYHKRGDDEGAVYWFKQALDGAEALPGQQREPAIAASAQWMARAGMTQEADAWRARLSEPADAAKIDTALALRLVEEEKVEAALGKIHAIAPQDARYEALSKLAHALAIRRDMRQAVVVARSIDNVMMRVKTFRDIAQVQAVYTDFYGLLAPENKTAKPMVDAESAMLSPLAAPEEKPELSQVDAFEQETIALSKERKDHLIVRNPVPSSIGQQVPTLSHISQLSYNDAYVRGLVPPSTPIVLKRVHYLSSVYNRKFVEGYGAAGFVLSRAGAAPDVLYLEKGVADLAAIHDTLAAQGARGYLEKKGRTYTLRKPLIVGPGAALIVAGSDVAEFRLSRDKGAYLVNAGDLYVIGTRLLGWNEAQNKPATATYEERHRFRPFIASWSRSHTYIASSEVVSLGFMNGKSYGISMTSGPEQLLKNAAEPVERPSATIVDSSFNNMLYGFYSYEADNVVLVGNEYVGNIVYGIDPHDRSRWFTIAYNTAYGTQKKHGIIISREVNHTTILGNVSFDNHGSGIMIDRQSNGTLIYANTAFANGQDGLTIFESSCKIIASNRFFDNERAGIKIRNSVNVGVFFNTLRYNQQAGFHSYTSKLTEDAEHAGRDFTLDPYNDVAAADLVGNWIEGNGVGIRAEDMAALYLKKNRFLHQSPKLLRGTWAAAFPAILAAHDIEDKGVFVTARCPKGKVMKRETCIFREEGYFDGDGQKQLAERVLHPCEDEISSAQGQGVP